MVRSVINLVEKCSRVSLFTKRRIHSSFKLYCYSAKTSAPVSNEREPSVLVEKDDHITLIGLNRPSRRNSIDSGTARHLCEALEAFEMDDSSPVAVLYGVGGSFCTGSDLEELDRQLQDNNVEALFRQDGGIGPTRRHLYKPVVCGISGYCVANGLELALLCDLRVMEQTAVLGFFNRHQGIPLSDGGTVRLPSIIGYARALDLLLTGRRVSSEEALQLGLVNRLVATGTALGQAVNLAFSIAKFPMAALRNDRNALYVNHYERQKLDAVMRREVMSLTEEVRQEMQEGVQRFKNSKLKGARTDSWQIKPKKIADWEKEEIAHEEEAAKKKLKGNG